MTDFKLREGLYQGKRGHASNFLNQFSYQSTDLLTSVYIFIFLKTEMMKLQKRWVESSSWKLRFAGIKLPWCFPQNIPARSCPDEPPENTAGGEIKDVSHPILLTRTSLPLHHMHTQPLLAFYNIPSLLSCCCNRTPDCHIKKGKLLQLKILRSKMHQE